MRITLVYLFKRHSMIGLKIFLSLIFIHLYNKNNIFNKNIAIVCWQELSYHHDTTLNQLISYLIFMTGIYQLMLSRVFNLAVLMD